MRKGLRVVATVTLFFFLTTQCVSAAPGAGIQMAGQRELPSYLSMDIPAELGTVDSLYEAPAGANPQFILHIQNAHANYQAQMKIKQLLGYMNKKYGFKTIFVEGASEKLDADYLRLFPDQERNLKLCDELAKQGELTGAELFLMEQSESGVRGTEYGEKNMKNDTPYAFRRTSNAVEALGIEQASLYKANYDALKKVFGAEADVTRFFKGFDGKLDKVASQTFTPETRELIADWKRFEQGRREFMPFVKVLAAKSKKILKVDLESLFAQVGWPQITRLLVIQQMEKDLNKTKGLEEKAALIKMLRTKGVSKELLATLESFSEGSIAVGKSATEVSPREVLERLAQEAGPQGFKFSDYPAFSLYAGYVTLRSELDPKVLFEEIEYLFTQMLDTLAQEPQQKALLTLYRDGELLRKLLHLELNRAQWQQLLANREQIAIPSLVARLKEAVQTTEGGGRKAEGAKAKTPSTILHPSSDVMPPAFGAKMDELFTAGLEFYDFAHKREAVFYKEMQSQMQERKITKAILITGGFHTDGMSDLFRENAISYGIVTPRLSEKSNENLYQKVMLQNRQYPFEVSYLEAAIKAGPLSGQPNPGEVVGTYLDMMMGIGAMTLPDAVKVFSNSQCAVRNEIRTEMVGPNADGRPNIRIVPRTSVAVPPEETLVLGDAAISAGQITPVKVPVLVGEPMLPKVEPSATLEREAAEKVVKYLQSIWSADLKKKYPGGVKVDGSFILLGPKDKIINPDELHLVEDVGSAPMSSFDLSPENLDAGIAALALATKIPVADLQKAVRSEARAKKVAEQVRGIIRFSMLGFVLAATMAICTACSSKLNDQWKSSQQKRDIDQIESAVKSGNLNAISEVSTRTSERLRSGSNDIERVAFDRLVLAAASLVEAQRSRAQKDWPGELAALSQKSTDAATLNSFYHELLLVMDQDLETIAKSEADIKAFEDATPGLGSWSMWSAANKVRDMLVSFKSVVAVERKVYQTGRERAKIVLSANDPAFRAKVDALNVLTELSPKVNELVQAAESASFELLQVTARRDDQFVGKLFSDTASKLAAQAAVEHGENANRDIRDIKELVAGIMQDQRFASVLGAGAREIKPGAVDPGYGFIGNTVVPPLVNGITGISEGKSSWFLVLSDHASAVSAESDFSSILSSVTAMRDAIQKKIAQLTSVLDEAADKEIRRFGQKQGEATSRATRPEFRATSGAEQRRSEARGAVKAVILLVAVAAIAGGVTWWIRADRNPSGVYGYEVTPAILSQWDQVRSLAERYGLSKEFPGFEVFTENGNRVTGIFSFSELDIQYWQEQVRTGKITVEQLTELWGDFQKVREIAYELRCPIVTPGANLGKFVRILRKKGGPALRAAMEEEKKGWTDGTPSSQTNTPPVLKGGMVLEAQRTETQTLPDGSVWKLVTEQGPVTKDANGVEIQKETKRWIQVSPATSGMVLEAQVQQEILPVEKSITTQGRVETIAPGVTRQMTTEKVKLPALSGGAVFSAQTTQTPARQETRSRSEGRAGNEAGQAREFQLSDIQFIGQDDPKSDFVEQIEFEQGRYVLQVSAYDKVAIQWRLGSRDPIHYSFKSKVSRPAGFNDDSAADVSVWLDADGELRRFEIAHTEKSSVIDGLAGWLRAQSNKPWARLNPDLHPRSEARIMPVADVERQLGELAQPRQFGKRVTLVGASPIIDARGNLVFPGDSSGIQIPIASPDGQTGILRLFANYSEGTGEQEGRIVPILHILAMKAGVEKYYRYEPFRSGPYKAEQLTTKEFQKAYDLYMENQQRTKAVRSEARKTVKVLPSDGKMDDKNQPGPAGEQLPWGSFSKTEPSAQLREPSKNPFIRGLQDWWRAHFGDIMGSWDRWVQKQAPQSRYVNTAVITELSPQLPWASFSSSQTPSAAETRGVANILATGLLISAGAMAAILTAGDVFGFFLGTLTRGMVLMHLTYVAGLAAAAGLLSLDPVVSALISTLRFLVQYAEAIYLAAYPKGITRGGKTVLESLKNFGRRLKANVNAIRAGDQRPSQVSKLRVAPVAGERLPIPANSQEFYDALYRGIPSFKTFEKYIWLAPRAAQTVQFVFRHVPADDVERVREFIGNILVPFIEKTFSRGVIVTQTGPAQDGANKFFAITLTRDPYFSSRDEAAESTVTYGKGLMPAQQWFGASSFFSFGSIEARLLIAMTKHLNFAQAVRYVLTGKLPLGNLSSHDYSEGTGVRFANLMPIAGETREILESKLAGIDREIRSLTLGRGDVFSSVGRQNISREYARATDIRNQLLRSLGRSEVRDLLVMKEEARQAIKNSREAIGLKTLEQMKRLANELTLAYAGIEESTSPQDILRNVKTIAEDIEGFKELGSLVLLTEIETALKILNAEMAKLSGEIETLNRSKPSSQSIPDMGGSKKAGFVVYANNGVSFAVTGNPSQDVVVATTALGQAGLSVSNMGDGVVRYRDVRIDLKGNSYDIMQQVDAALRRRSDRGRSEARSDLEKVRKFYTDKRPQHPIAPILDKVIQMLDQGNDEDALKGLEEAITLAIKDYNTFGLGMMERVPSQETLAYAESFRMLQAVREAIVTTTEKDEASVIFEALDIIRRYAGGPVHRRDSGDLPSLTRAIQGEYERTGRALTPAVRAHIDRVMSKLEVVNSSPKLKEGVKVTPEMIAKAGAPKTEADRIILEARTYIPDIAKALSLSPSEFGDFLIDRNVDENGKARKGTIKDIQDPYLIGEIARLGLAGEKFSGAPETGNIHEELAKRLRSLFTPGTVDLMLAQVTVWEDGNIYMAPGAGAAFQRGLNVAEDMLRSEASVEEFKKPGSVIRRLETQVGPFTVVAEYYPYPEEMQKGYVKFFYGNVNASYALVAWAGEIISETDARSRLAKAYEELIPALQGKLDRKETIGDHSFDYLLKPILARAEARTVLIEEEQPLKIGTQDGRDLTITWKRAYSAIGLQINSIYIEAAQSGKKSKGAWIGQESLGYKQALTLEGSPTFELRFISGGKGRTSQEPAQVKLLVSVRSEAKGISVRKNAVGHRMIYAPNSTGKNNRVDDARAFLTGALNLDLGSVQIYAPRLVSELDDIMDEEVSAQLLAVLTPEDYVVHLKTGDFQIIRQGTPAFDALLKDSFPVVRASDLLSRSEARDFVESQDDVTKWIIDYSPSWSDIAPLLANELARLALKNVKFAEEVAARLNSKIGNFRLAQDAVFFGIPADKRAEMEEVFQLAYLRAVVLLVMPVNVVQETRTYTDPKPNPEGTPKAISLDEQRRTAADLANDVNAFLAEKNKAKENQAGGTQAVSFEMLDKVSTEDVIDELGRILVGIEGKMVNVGSEVAELIRKYQFRNGPLSSLQAVKEKISFTLPQLEMLYLAAARASYGKKSTQSPPKLNTNPSMKEQQDWRVWRSTLEKKSLVGLAREIQKIDAGLLAEQQRKNINEAKGILLGAQDKLLLLPEKDRDDMRENFTKLGGAVDDGKWPKVVDLIETLMKQIPKPAPVKTGFLAKLFPAKEEVAPQTLENLSAKIVELRNFAENVIARAEMRVPVTVGEITALIGNKNVSFTYTTSLGKRVTVKGDLVDVKSTPGSSEVQVTIKGQGEKLKSLYLFVLEGPIGVNDNGILESIRRSEGRKVSQEETPFFKGMAIFSGWVGAFSLAFMFFANTQASVQGLKWSAFQIFQHELPLLAAIFFTLGAAFWIVNHFVEARNARIHDERTAEAVDAAIEMISSNKEVSQRLFDQYLRVRRAGSKLVMTVYTNEWDPVGSIDISNLVPGSFSVVRDIMGNAMYFKFRDNINDAFLPLEQKALLNLNYRVTAIPELFRKPLVDVAEVVARAEVRMSQQERETERAAQDISAGTGVVTLAAVFTYVFANANAVLGSITVAASSLIIGIIAAGLTIFASYWIVRGVYGAVRAIKTSLGLPSTPPNYRPARNGHWFSAPVADPDAKLAALEAKTRAQAAEKAALAKAVRELEGEVAQLSPFYNLKIQKGMVIVGKEGLADYGVSITRAQDIVKALLSQLADAQDLTGLIFIKIPQVQGVMSRGEKEFAEALMEALVALKASVKSVSSQTRKDIVSLNVDVAAAKKQLAEFSKILGRAVPKGGRSELREKIIFDLEKDVPAINALLEKVRGIKSQSDEIRSGMTKMTDLFVYANYDNGKLYDSLVALRDNLSLPPEFKIEIDSIFSAALANRLEAEQGQDVFIFEPTDVPTINALLAKVNEIGLLQPAVQEILNRTKPWDFDLEKKDTGELYPLLVALKNNADFPILLKPELDGVLALAQSVPQDLPTKRSESRATAAELLPKVRAALDSIEADKRGLKSGDDAMEYFYNPERGIGSFEAQLKGYLAFLESKAGTEVIESQLADEIARRVSQVGDRIKDANDAVLGTPSVQTQNRDALNKALEKARAGASILDGLSETAGVSRQTVGDVTQLLLGGESLRSESRVLDKTESLKIFNRVMDIDQEISRLRGLIDVNTRKQPAGTQAKIDALLVEKENLLKPEVPVVAPANPEMLLLTLPGLDVEIKNAEGKKATLVEKKDVLVKSLEKPELGALERQAIGRNIAKLEKSTGDIDGSIEKLKDSRKANLKELLSRLNELSPGELVGFISEAKGLERILLSENELNEQYPGLMDNIRKVLAYTADREIARGSVAPAATVRRAEVRPTEELVVATIDKAMLPIVQQAKLGVNPKAVEALDVPGVKGAIIVSAVAGMIFDAGLTVEQMAETIVRLANASVPKAEVWVTAVRNALAGVMDKEGLAIEGVDATDFDIVPEDLGTLANSKQRKAYVVMADAADVKAMEAKRVAIMKFLAPTLKALDAEKRFDIIVINKSNPRLARATLAKFANNKMGTMAPTLEGQRNYVLMGSTRFLDFFKDAGPAVMISEPFSRDVNRRVATSILASIVSQRILSASEIDAIKEVLNVKKDDNGFYSFSQAALSKMLTIALQVAQAIQSAA